MPNADERLVKAQLVFKIDKIVKQRRLQQTEAAGLFGAASPTARRCCVATSGSFPLSASCASSWRSIGMSISL